MPKRKGRIFKVFIAAVLGMSFSSSASVRLPLKHHPQLKNLSCETASLRMVLNFHKVVISEAEIIKKMPFDSTPKGKGIWGDPDTGFVGDIDGKMGETGYGIHWNALAKLSSTWKKTSVLSENSVAELVKHLEERRPVIIWMVEGEKRDISWKTPKGKKVFALHNEHTQVVYGYEGTKDAPTSFHVMDPIKGPQVRETAEFLKEWDSFGRKGIVVYH